MPSSAARSRPVAAEDVVRFLKESFPGAGPVRRIDTHAGHIFLCGDRAWKLKRPVKLGYLDFSTRERRKAALEAELSLNRRTAPELYIGLHAITRAAGGGISLDGDGPPIDWLLEMHRFPDGALLDDLAGRGALDGGLMIRLADRLHDFHEQAAIAPDPAGAARVAAVIDGNEASLAAGAGIFGPGAAAALIARQRNLLVRHGGLLDARARGGRVRHCHGDLHLANIALIDGEPVPFDCLEFDAELATTDVLYDLAFLLMDLWHRDLHAEANQLFNRYLDLSAEDEEGAALMPLFMSIRATIRAHVSATQALQGDREAARRKARLYLDLAGSLLDPVPPVFLAIGGRSGTGKSTLARALGSSIGVAPGARILRTDVLRKQMAGLTPEARIPKDRYTPEASRQVYDALDRRALALIRAGSSVIADAAFLQPDERDAARAIAMRGNTAFLGLWLEAGIDTRVSRVTARSRDASDADAGVVRLQARRPVGVIADGWHRLRAGDAPGRVARAALALVKRYVPKVVA